MNEVEVLVLDTNKTFIKHFDDVREQRKFMIKCKYSKKLMVLSFTWNGQAQYEYLMWGK